MYNPAQTTGSWYEVEAAPVRTLVFWTFFACGMVPWLTVVRLAAWLSLSEDFFGSVRD